LLHILLSAPSRRTVAILLLLASVVCAARPLPADDFTDRRLTIGSKILRALLAADRDLERKVTDSGEVSLCLLYTDDPRNAEKAAETLTNRDDPRIRGRNVRVDKLTFAECLADPAESYTAIFLTQRLGDDELARVVALSREKNQIVFSPFEGDVERGVQSGIAVEGRVRPYLNLAALREAGIRLKHFFIDVAKTHE
jgi:hypothetical protein